MIYRVMLMPAPLDGSLSTIYVGTERPSVQAWYAQPIYEEALSNPVRYRLQYVPPSKGEVWRGTAGMPAMRSSEPAL